jgi:hypothetical protein
MMWVGYYHGIEAVSAESASETSVLKADSH